MFLSAILRSFPRLHQSLYISRSNLFMHSPLCLFTNFPLSVLFGFLVSAVSLSGSLLHETWTLPSLPKFPLFFPPCLFVPLPTSLTYISIPSLAGLTLTVTPVSATDLRCSFRTLHTLKRRWVHLVSTLLALSPDGFRSHWNHFTSFFALEMRLCSPHCFNFRRFVSYPKALAFSGDNDYCFFFKCFYLLILSGFANL